MIDAPAKALETLSRSLTTKDLAARVGRLVLRVPHGDRQPQRTGITLPLGQKLG